MNELTQLERARAVVDAFVPQDKPGSTSIYAFQGKASWDATTYEFIDGLCLATSRVWHVDFSKVQYVGYIGKARYGRRISDNAHPFVPPKELQIGLASGLSDADAITLEAALIKELGCIADPTRDDGCLTNIRLSDCGPFCCPSFEARLYKLSKHTERSVAAATQAKLKDAVLFDSNIKLIHRGSLKEIAEVSGIDARNISKLCRRVTSRMWSPILKTTVHCCFYEDFDTYEVTNRSPISQHRKIIVVALDGSKTLIGTASEIAAQVPQIKHSSALHRVAQGIRPFCYGYTARYVDKVADELEAPVATCGPNLSAFF